MFVGQAARLQALHKFDHLVDVLGRSWVVLSRSNTQPAKIVKKGLRVTSRVIPQALFQPGRTSDCLIVDIGDVHHQLNFVPIPFKNPAHHVNPYVEAKVSDMGIVVHCRATGVDADLLCLKWHEWLEAAGPGVVEMKLGDHRNTTAQASRATITCWPSAASWV